MRRLASPSLIALLVMGATFPARAAELNDYLRAAISNGDASGVVTGAIAKTVAAQTGSDDLLVASVKTVGAFASPECKRLRVSLLKKSVKSIEGPVVDLSLPPFEVNMCLDGKPPAETLTPDVQKQQREAALDTLGKIPRSAK
ncbi:MAG: hypothetical protein OEL20_05450 [Sulfuritalea sp.]|nr:hypothetical protein [Sulfuritalea sp.]